MIFLINNASYLLPIYIIQDQKTLQFPYFLLVILEIFLHFISIYYVIKCIYIVWSIRTFHKNLTVLVIIFGIQWFEAVTANILMKPYEIGKVQISNSTTIIKQFFTSDPLNFIRVPVDHRIIPFFIGGFIRWHFIFSMTTVVLGVSMERAFACFFLVDYEKKTRNYIWIGIFLICQVYNLVVSGMFFFCFFHFYWFIGFSVLPNLMGVVTLSLSRLYTLRVTATIENFSNPTNYTLAARFQAKENVRCFQMITRVINVGMALMIFTSILTTIIFLDLFPNSDTLLNFMFQSIFSTMGPLIICPCILFSVEAWRKCELMSNPLYSMVLKKRRQKVAIAKYNDKDATIKKDTDTYFNQLNASWN